MTTPDLLDANGRGIKKKPTISKNLKSTWTRAKTYALSIIAVIAVLGGLAANIEKINKLFQFESPTPHIQTNNVPQSHQQRNDPVVEQGKSKPNQYPSVFITFSDGKSAEVEFTMITRIQEENASLVVVRSGSREKAEDTLLSFLESEITSQLESITLAKARAERSEIPNKITSKLESRFLELGVTLDAVLLNQIKTLN